MQDQPAKRSWLSSFSKWIGLQVAGKTVGVALGTPAVAAAVMAVLAYLQSLPLAYGFLTVLLAAASTAVIMNQIRVFWMAYTPANKVFAEGTHVLRVKDDAGKDGYGVAVSIRNASDIPMQYRISRQNGELNGTVVKSAKDASKGDVIEPRGNRLHMMGVVYIPPVPDGEALKGEIECAFQYGRPGQLSHHATYSRVLTVTMLPDGTPIHTNAHVAET